jgi:hypothetical protein
VYIRVKPKRRPLRMGTCAKLVPHYCGLFEYLETLLHMIKFSTVFRCYCHTYPSHFPRRQTIFFVEIFSSLYPRTRYLWKQRRNQATMCHHPKYRYTFLRRKNRGNSDEKSKKCARVKNPPITCDADAILATKKRGKLQRNIVEITTKKCARVKKPTNGLRHRCHTCDEKAWKVAMKNRGNSDDK